MTYRSICLLLILLIIASLSISAQAEANKLGPTEYSMARISASTATGDLENLTLALNQGLDNGLTINKIKEELVHLYAYCGFPRSLMAINTFTDVLEKRKERGIKDEIGEEPTNLKGGDKYEIGKEVLEDLTGTPADGPKAGYAKTVPIIEVFLKEHLFADIFKRGVLSFKEREIATVAALLTMGDLAPMATGHIRISMRLGVTVPQISQILDIIETEVDKTEVDKNVAQEGRELLAGITSKKPSQSNIVSTENYGEKIYPKGKKINNSVFTGAAWLKMLVEADEVNRNSVGVVTFEPGARTFWHQHPNGQIILALSGEGYYQEKGSAKKILRKGDVAKCPANILHWHGAGPDGEFVQIAITSRIGGATQWFKKVTDKEYND